MLTSRRERIEQGLKDAEQARSDRESAEQERKAALAEARREANEILARAQKVAQETRDADIAATRAELDRMRTRATSEIEAEKQRALGRSAGRGRGPRPRGGQQGRRRDHERRAPAPARRGIPRRRRPETRGTDGADSSTATRRYAEAAFELAERDDAFEAWATGLALAAGVAADDAVARMADNPAVSYDSRAGRRLEHSSRIGWRPASSTSPGCSPSAAGSRACPAVAAEFTRLLNRRNGIVEAVVTSAAPLSAAEIGRHPQPGSRP